VASFAVVTPLPVRRALAAATVAVAALTALADGMGAASAATPERRPAAGTTLAPVGTMFHGMWQFYTDPERAAVLDQLAAAGVTSVRLDVSWAMLQPSGPGSYDGWGVGFVDHVIDMINQRGMRPLVLLWLTPDWANRGQGEHTLPDNPGDYARVAKWVAARYGDRVLGWEVWNEQNSPDFLDGADPVAYTRLLKAAYPAFHAGSLATPVLFGGVQYNDTDWIKRAYDAGAKGHFDVLAVHPYLGPSDLPGTLADNGSVWTLNHVRTVHDLMAARGDGAKAIWFTEFGWSTHGNSDGTPPWALGVTEATQARYLTETVAYVRAQLPFVTRMYWYNEKDLPVGSEHVMHYGLLRADDSPKPALAALATANATGGTPAPMPVAMRGGLAAPPKAKAPPPVRNPRPAPRPR
jgi:polysaccharide biosynthesis protein PslG